MWPWNSRPTRIVVVHALDPVSVKKIVRAIDRLGAARVTAAETLRGLRDPKNAKPTPVKPLDRAKEEFVAAMDARGWDSIRKNDYLVKFERWRGRACTPAQLEEAQFTLSASDLPLPQSA